MVDAADSPPIAARERFVAEASHLFASKGFHATSVADIQLACGLSAGSGALYKHFRSKEALLDDVVRIHIATMREGSGSFLDEVPDDLAEALRFVVQVVWAGLERDRQVLRVMLRDLDDYPDTLATIWDEVRANVYDEFTRWLVAEQQRGTVRSADPAATAAVLLASLTYVPILQTLIGRTPGDIDTHRFADAWVKHATATLTTGSTGRASAQPNGGDE